MTTSIRPGHLFLNRFLIAEVIPGGGMADVFRANDQRVRRQVVIKSQRAGEEGVAFQARFQREVEVLGGVQHPFVLPLLDAGTLEDRRVWFAVPFVRDRCLRYQIEECRRAFDRAQAVQLGLDICEALQAVHDKQWVHADVKPANVLVSGRHFVLADFGIASRLDSTVLPHAEARTARLACYPNRTSLTPRPRSGERRSSFRPLDTRGLRLRRPMTVSRWRWCSTRCWQVRIRSTG
ncbi:MAG: protein kinase [Gemmatimonadetes bacterium]|nr:protein kinase [Gemmatimonadota bacterium]